MTISELIEILPKPPEREGLFPRIGIVNITNATICLYESKYDDDKLFSSRKLLLKLDIPDQFFLPVADLTVGEFTIYLLHEATIAFRNSISTAIKLANRTAAISCFAYVQNEYLDHWFSTGLLVFHNTQENVWKGIVVLMERCHW